MCGIFAINQNNKDLALDSINKIAYRGPDNCTVWSDDFVTMAHARLSIIDLDQRSNQPMWNTDKSVAVIFNGEIYNFKEIQKDILFDYDFKTSSDTEVILALYEKYGANMFDYLNGMFAIAIYDLKKKKFFVGRDCVGIKPLYFFNFNQHFIVGSELKAVTEAVVGLGFKLKINKEILPVYYAMGYFPSPYTMYKNFEKLLPGHFIEYDLDNKKILVNKKFNPTKNKIGAFSSDSDLFEKINSRILSQLVSDVPVGLFFSGGTDSTVIASTVYTKHPSFNAFSVLMDHKNEDKKMITDISQSLDLNLHVTFFDNSMFEDVYEDIMSKMDDPIYDTSVFPSFVVAREASKKVKVVLSGEGGDEFFLGYPRQKTIYEMNSLADYKYDFWDKFYAVLPYFRGKNRLFKKLFMFLKKPLSFYFLEMSHRMTGNALCKMKKMAFMRNVEPIDLDKVFYLENDLLRKTDMVTSYNSIEGRVPLLDQEIIFSLDLFKKRMLEGGVSKFFLKKYLEKYLSNDLIYRGKSGFSMDIKKVFSKSTKMSLEIKSAFYYLKSFSLLPHGVFYEFQIKNEPYLQFMIVALWRSLKNTGYNTDT
jgi:asparagine synthase (glutamine-hydrolysing)